MNKSKSIDLVEKPYDKKLKGFWNGFLNTQFLFTELYINKHYSKLLHYLPYLELNIVHNTDINTYNFNIIDYNIPMSYNKKNNKKEFEYYIKLYKNTDKRFTYFPIDQKITAFDQIERSHAIFFIYDKLLNQLELFDPNADNFHYYKNFFKKFFTKIYGKKIKIIYPDLHCPFFGELHLEKCNDKKYKFKSDGFCVAWNLWYLELRLKNEKLTRNEVITKALNLLKKDNRICKLIRGYSHFIQDITNNFEILFKNGIYIISIKKKTNYIIPKILITLLGVSGAILFIIKKMNLFNKQM